MSNKVTYVKGDELTALANSLKSKGESIFNEYKGNCSQALEMSTECLQLSGLNITEFFQALEKIYSKLNQRVAEFSDFLTNVVVAEYNMVNEAIVNNFNGKFAAEMSSILGIPMTSSIGPITNPKLSGEDGPIAEIQPIEKEPGVEIPLDPQPKPDEQIMSDGGKGGKDFEAIGIEPLNKEQTMTREEGNESPVPVYLDDDGTAVAVVSKDTDPSVSIPTDTPTDTTTSSGGKDFAAIGIEPLPKTVSRQEGNNSPTPVYLDDNGTAVKVDTQPSVEVTPAVQPETPSVTTPKATTKDFSAIGITPLPKGSGSGYSSGRGVAATHLGGGGGGMTNIAFANDMGNPLVSKL